MDMLARRFLPVSKRRARNRRLVCYCTGWWFPHRRGSKASPDVKRRLGTAGCGC